MPQQLLVIANRKAGSVDKESINRALNVLREGAWVEVRTTGNLDELTDALANTEDRTIVVAGGDGSLHAVVQTLHNLDQLNGRTLGLLPLGTGNDFSRTLGIPRSARKSARVILNGEARPTDLLVDDQNQVTVNNVHFGAGAKAGTRGARWKKRLHWVSAAADPGAASLGPTTLGPLGVDATLRVGLSELGKLGYPLGALQTAISPPTLRLRIEVDGEVVVDPGDEVLMAAVGNGATVGGGLALTPNADPHDGLLDVMVATPMAVLDQLEYVLRLQVGSHESYAKVRTARGRSVSISGEPFDVNSDGELDGPLTDRTWRVLPAAYSMIVPRAEE